MSALDVINAHAVYSSPIARLAVHIIEDLALERDGVRSETLVRIRDTVASIVGYLAANPTETTVRVRLSEALGLDVVGHEGVHCLVDVILDMMERRPIAYIRKSKHAGMAVGELQRSKTYSGVLRWLNARMPVALGNIALPEELVKEPADDLVPPMMEVVEHAATTLGEDGDTRTLLLAIAFVVAINPYTEAKNYDLLAIRTAADSLAIAGEAQLARDLAEQGLELANGNSRKRIAWYSVADIYHRLNNSTESLIALACAVSGDPNVDIDEAWHEMNGLTRIMRDLRFFDVARAAHAASWDILKASGDAEAGAYRHDFMSLTIDIGEAWYADEVEREKLLELAARATRAAHEVISHHDNVNPVAMIVGQVLYWCRGEGIEPPSELKQLFKKLLSMASANVRKQARALSKATPEPEDLLRIHRSTMEARYAEDSGFDVRLAGVVARTMLSGAAKTNSTAAALGIELLSDRAIPAPGWSITSAPLPKLASVGTASEMAGELSREGVSILQMGVSRDNHLVGVDWGGGRGRVSVESKDVFSVTHYRDWQSEFPYRYGIDETTPNLFYTSTEHLMVSTLPSPPFIVVADAELQQFPVGLLRSSDDFSGNLGPVAAAPSLSWLTESRRNPLKTNGKMFAWISGEQATGYTLATVIDRLSPTFEAYDITLNTEAEIPVGLFEAELVVITAHGGLGSENRFFQRVSDEGSLVTTGKRLASYLRNIGVVVLFVCSGGRVDKSPDATATLGLARALLAEGCSAVIASPWPLDSRVTYHWLPTFLNSWSAGKTLMEATFDANQAVRSGLGEEPWKTLAMTVYGDALRKYGT
ncbi:CHAT domain-containing protein [Rhizobium sp. BK068]|uniref:CHAT domain-containing protein n=1 Tax=Rhizobium sp. BK068 TaxID=2512130 RepID=UPI0014050AC0|nr:CHAT domain-containing protein [Rhizobium sp. BK068]